MKNLLSFFTALVLSMAIIPLMMRLAPRLGMIDSPDPRKVHRQPVPRVGGVGIVLGALLPLVLWEPPSPAIHAYLLGSLVILGFGVWDDCCELGHYVKFIGQFIAVISVVYYGDIFVNTVPFFHRIPDGVGKPFTVFAMIGMINAINHSDGLDGLAGGLTMLSLMCIAYLGFESDSGLLLVVTMATMGGVLGFLRYNTHPATVFMGDSGSQFLGFTSGFLVVLLTQNVNPALSRSLPALILGLPIIDILAVFAQRVYHGMNWFRATKNHIHHRLLDLGFDHYEAVVIIYSVQTLFVVSAVVLKYAAGGLLLSLYFVICAAVFGFLILAERNGWRAHQRQSASGLAKGIAAIRSYQPLRLAPTYFIAVAIPLLLVSVSVLAPRVPYILGLNAAALGIALLVDLLWLKQRGSIVLRAISYVTSAFVIYLGTTYGAWTTHLDVDLDISYFTVLAIAVGLTIYYAADHSFDVTPTDYLIIIIVVAAGTLLRGDPEQIVFGSMAIKLAILFYGCELMLSRAKTRWNPITISVLATLAVLSVRGLV